MRLTDLQKNWRGMTVSSAFQIPGFALLVVVSLAVGITMLFSEHVEYAPNHISSPLPKEDRKIFFDADSQ